MSPKLLCQRCSSNTHAAEKCEIIGCLMVSFRCLWNARCLMWCWFPFQIRNRLDDESHALFQQKLRDQTLMKMPNFRWCSHVSTRVNVSSHVSTRVNVSSHVSTRVNVSSHVSTRVNVSSHVSTRVNVSSHVSTRVNVSSHVSTRVNVSSHVSTRVNVRIWMVLLEMSGSGVVFKRKMFR